MSLSVYGCVSGYSSLKVSFVGPYPFELDVNQLTTYDLCLLSLSIFEVYVSTVVVPPRRPRTLKMEVLETVLEYQL